MIDLSVSNRAISYWLIRIRIYSAERSWALFRIISQSLLCIFMLDSAIFYSVKMIESFILQLSCVWEIGRPIERYLENKKFSSGSRKYRVSGVSALIHS